MFGSKSRKITDLTRALRLRTAERDAAKADARAAAYAARKAARLYAAQDTAERLARALRACAGYRAELAAARRYAASLEARPDNAVGLDHPDIDAGAKWQDRRRDVIKGAVR
ncbi:hypothetical protein [Streptomyces sp. NPDC086023]|uniref:hypothetical protein n=1 Tax=Streptomyces sp. NPDC086023 TaxID=3365746 RepID=UPI0037D14CDA